MVTRGFSWQIYLISVLTRFYVWHPCLDGNSFSVFILAFYVDNFRTASIVSLTCETQILQVLKYRLPQPVSWDWLKAQRSPQEKRDIRNSLFDLSEQIHIEECHFNMLPGWNLAFPLALAIYNLEFPRVNCSIAKG